MPKYQPCCDAKAPVRCVNDARHSVKIHSEMLHTNILDDMYNSTIWVCVTLDPEICQYPFLAVKGDKTGRSFK